MTKQEETQAKRLERTSDDYIQIGKYRIYRKDWEAEERWRKKSFRPINSKLR